MTGILLTRGIVPLVCHTVVLPLDRIELLEQLDIKIDSGNIVVPK